MRRTHRPRTTPRTYAPTAIRTPTHDTAILFFSHRPARAWQNKWFVRNDRAKTQSVADALYRHTLQAGRASGLPVLEVTDAQQRGSDFGTRLANAFADAFAAGYAHVIAVGSDCPRLHEVDWDAVTGQLERGAPVLGPTADGHGAYLIGLSHAQFRRDTFAGLPWQSPDLLGALTQHLRRAAGSPHLLAARRDVNTPADLAALLAAPAPGLAALVRWLRCILGAAAAVPFISTIRLSGRPRTFRSRGPPVQA